MSDAVQPRAWRFVADLGALAREAQQLANHYSALLRRLVDIDLKPEKETPTLFKWGGKRVYMRNFSGSTTEAVTPLPITGVETIVLLIGPMSSGSDQVLPQSTDSSTGNVIWEDGTLSVVRIGFTTLHYDYTVFYTRVGN